jgi:hypothetical protein
MPREGDQLSVNRPATAPHPIPWPPRLAAMAASLMVLVGCGAQAHSKAVTQDHVPAVAASATATTQLTSAAHGAAPRNRSRPKASITTHRERSITSHRERRARLPGSGGSPAARTKRVPSASATGDCTAGTKSPGCASHHQSRPILNHRCQAVSRSAGCAKASRRPSAGAICVGPAVGEPAGCSTSSPPDTTGEAGAKAVGVSSS